MRYGQLAWASLRIGALHTRAPQLEGVDPGAKPSDGTRTPQRDPRLPGPLLPGTITRSLICSTQHPANRTAQSQHTKPCIAAGTCRSRWNSAPRSPRDLTAASDCAGTSSTAGARCRSRPGRRELRPALQSPLRSGTDRCYCSAPFRRHRPRSQSRPGQRRRR